MVYRHPHAAPRSRLPEERQGRIVGYFCTVCGSIYPLHRGRHSGKSLYGRDHVASPCAHEGDAFAEGAGWWDYAVEVLPEAAAGDPGIAGSPERGTEPSAVGPAAPGGPVNAPGKGPEPTATGVTRQPAPPRG